MDNRISVPAQHSLVRLSKNPATSSDAVGMLEEVKAGRLAAIYCVNWKKAALRAQRFGKYWWTVIPQGEDGVLMLDPDNVAAGPPIIAFRRELDPRDKDGCGKLKTDKTLTPSPARIDAALLKTWASYKLWQSGKLAQCAQPSLHPPVTNVMPPGFCQKPDQVPASAEEQATLTVEVAGLQAVGVLPSWRIVTIPTSQVIAQQTARSLAVKVPVNTPILITMSVPRPAYLPPAGEWLRVDQRVMLTSPGGAIVPVPSSRVAGDVRAFVAPGMPAPQFHPRVTVEPLASARLLGEGGQAASKQKMVFTATFIDVTNDVAKDVPPPKFRDTLLNECGEKGMDFRVFQETWRSRKDLWAVAFKENKLTESKRIHCLLNLRHTGERDHGGLAQNLNLFAGGLKSLWGCEPAKSPFFITEDLNCKQPRAGFLRQLARANKPVFIATPLTDPESEIKSKEVPWLGLIDAKNGAPRHRMEELARAVIQILPEVQDRPKPIVDQMRLAVAGWSFGAFGAIEVLKAHAKDIDELYWFDPAHKTATSSANEGFLQIWLSQQGSRGPRFLRLMGGIENESFQRLASRLTSFAKHGNRVRAMVPFRFWEKSAPYKFAITVPPPSPLTQGQRFPEPISCATTSTPQTDCKNEPTALAFDTGVYLSKVLPGAGVKVVGKDREGKEPEKPMRFALSLSELKGLLRFAFRSPKTKFAHPCNLKSEFPLYEGSGFDLWTLKRLKKEFERLAMSEEGFRHRWAIAGGLYFANRTPLIPTNGPAFIGFLQMCLENGVFPS